MKMVLHSAADERSEETTPLQQQLRQPQENPPPSLQTMAAPEDSTVGSQHEPPKSVASPKDSTVRSQHERSQAMAVKSSQAKPQSSAPETVKSQTQPQHQKQDNSRPLHIFSFTGTKWFIKRGRNHLHHSPSSSRTERSSNSPLKEAITENKEEPEKMEEKKPAGAVVSEEDDRRSKLVISIGGIQVGSKEVVEAGGHDGVMAVKVKEEEAEVEEEDDDEDDDKEDEDVAFEDHVEPKTWELRPRSGRISGAGQEFKRPREQKLRIPLTKEEIEADFMAMTGAKPPKKPHKRRKTVEKNIDTILPGLSLQSSTITPDRYFVEDSLP